MRTIKNRLISTLFLSMSILVIGVIAVDTSTFQETLSLFPREPTADGIWRNPPVVLVCKGAPVSESRVRRALSVWKRLGYEFYDPIFDDTSEWCISDSYAGAITIDLNGQDFPDGNLAVTRTFHTRHNKSIVGAKIQILSRASTKERVLEHEIGHALGWNHFPRKYHLMNPTWEFGGWDTFGLTYKALSRYIPISDIEDIDILITEHAE